MQYIVFTLCSNNYLAHAKTLADSVIKFNPDFKVVIGLVDKRHPEIDYVFFKPHEIIDYDAIGFPFFDEMLAIYNIVEFNTSVKPYYFEFLFNEYGKESRIYYIDPDIVVYDSLSQLNTWLDTHDILLTPNVTVASEEVNSGELASLRHGIFNLGFIGVKYSDESMRFIKWWQNRLRRHCIISKPLGLFVDQKWIDLAPLFFSGIYVIYDVGYNMAWWNLCERNLIEDKGKYFVNDRDHPLIFFHFSGYKLGSANYSGRVNDSEEYSFKAHPELIDIFNEYAELLIINEYNKYSQLKPGLNFFIPKKPDLAFRIKRRLMKEWNQFLKKLKTYNLSR